MKAWCTHHTILFHPLMVPHTKVQLLHVLQEPGLGGHVSAYLRETELFDLAVSGDIISSQIYNPPKRYGGRDGCYEVLHVRSVLQERDQRIDSIYIEAIFKSKDIRSILIYWTADVEELERDFDFKSIAVFRIGVISRSLQIVLDIVPNESSIRCPCHSGL